MALPSGVLRLPLVPLSEDKRGVLQELLPMKGREQV